MGRPWVFQMGKVGSSAMIEAIDGIQVHHLDWGNLLYSLRGSYNRHQLNALLMRAVRPRRIITAVREPVARNLSAFMQNHVARGWAPTIESFMANFRHDEPLDWFDAEMKPFTGIDVFDHPFPHGTGWQLIDDRLLVLRAEAPDAAKEEAVSRFLGREVKLGRANVGEDKAYAAAYDELRRSVPADYVDRMLGSRYARHFYSAEEIERFRAKWRSLARGEPAAKAA